MSSTSDTNFKKGEDKGLLVKEMGENTHKCNASAGLKISRMTGVAHPGQLGPLEGILMRGKSSAEWEEVEEPDGQGGTPG